MPTLLSDPPQWLYLVLGGLLVVSGALAAQKQDRRAIIPFGIAFLLMMFLFLLDKFFESPREEATRRVFLMSVAADAKNPDAFVEHVADKVEVPTALGGTKTLTREELKKSPFWDQLKQFQVQVSVSGFSSDDVKVIDENTVEIGFVAKGQSQGQQIPLYGRATFRKQSDGSYKLTAFKAFEFIDRTKPFPIPMSP
jgi:hypothetical protein